MRIRHYSPHVLGIGHFFRSLEITHALSNHHDLTLVSGEREIGITLPSNISHYPLPPLAMDANFPRLIHDENATGIRASLMVQALAEEPIQHSIGLNDNTSTAPILRQRALQ